MNRLRGWIARRPITWAGSIFGVALLLGVGIGMGEEDDSDLRDELATVEAERDGLQADLDDAAAEVAELEGLREEAAQEARQRSRQLDEREEGLEERAAELDQQEERQALQVIDEDGVWEVGVEIEPGTYRSGSGGSCYWAKLQEPGGAGIDNIIANGSGANQTVTIDSPWFETSRCGEWRRIGD